MACLADFVDKVRHLANTVRQRHFVFSS